MQKLHDFLLYNDLRLWYLLNAKWHNSFLDALIPFCRNPFFWVPLYIFLLVFFAINFGKKGLLWCGGFILTFAASDQLSAHLIKPIVHRTRPCNNPYLINMGRLLVECGSGYSFPSSHAANHFALAVFMIITMRKYFKWIAPVALIWAILVCYGQVYVGVHFPLDVFGGGLVGVITGLITGGLFNRYVSLQPLASVTTA